MDFGALTIAVVGPTRRPVEPLVRPPNPPERHPKDLKIHRGLQLDLRHAASRRRRGTRVKGDDDVCDFIGERLKLER